MKHTERNSARHLLKKKRKDKRHSHTHTIQRPTMISIYAGHIVQLILLSNAELRTLDKTEQITNDYTMNNR